MAVLVVNQDGVVSHSPNPPKSKDDPSWDDEAQAEARVKQANADAEALGIKARYKVIPA